MAARGHRDETVLGPDGGQHRQVALAGQRQQQGLEGRLGRLIVEGPAHGVGVALLGDLVRPAGRPRQDSWKHLAERTDVDSVRNLVTMMIQAEQFGTSIGKTLRTHSDTLRTQRIQQVEEAAAKTTIKLIFPLVFFIFPSLFLVVLGPAIIIMMDSFKTLFHS